MRQIGTVTEEQAIRELVEVFWSTPLATGTDKVITACNHLNLNSDQPEVKIFMLDCYAIAREKALERAAEMLEHHNYGIVAPHQIEFEEEDGKCAWCSQSIYARRIKS